MSPNRSAKELSSISKHKTVATDMTEKTFVSDGLCSGVSYDAVGRELGVNESAACVKRGVLKQKHTQSEVVYWSADEKTVTWGWWQHISCFSQEPWFGPHWLRVRGDFIKHRSHEWQRSTAFVNSTLSILNLSLIYNYNSFSIYNIIYLVCSSLFLIDLPEICLYWFVWLFFAFCFFFPKESTSGSFETSIKVLLWPISHLAVCS